MADTRKQRVLETGTSLSSKISPWQGISLLSALLSPCSLCWHYRRVIPGRCQNLAGYKAHFSSQLSSNALRMGGMGSDLLHHKQIRGYPYVRKERDVLNPATSPLFSHSSLKGIMPRLLQDQTCTCCTGQVPSHPR